MNLEEQRLMVELIRNRRWAALATHSADGPEASWVAYIPEVDFGGFLLHLSTLASHTRNLLAYPHASLAISAPEREDEDPQTLARVTVQGEVAIIPKDAANYAAAAKRYQERLPASTPRFDFADFLLLRLNPLRVRFVGGFARAYTLDGPGLKAAAQRTS